MSGDEHVYGEGKPPIPAINEPTVVFMINRSLPSDGWDDLDVYRATQCSWVLGENARYNAVIALGVSHGVIRGAFRIDGWRSAEGDRWCFDGRTAKGFLHVIGTSFAKVKAPQGASNPVRWFPNGIPAREDE